MAPLPAPCERSTRVAIVATASFFAAMSQAPLPVTAQEQEHERITDEELARAPSALIATSEAATPSFDASSDAPPAASRDFVEQAERVSEPVREHTEPGDDAHPMDERPVEGNIHFAPGGGLRIMSDDRHFGIQLGSRVQLRWTAQASPSEDPEHEITLRRARIVFAGHLFEHVHFKLELAISPADLGATDNLDPDLRSPTQSPLLDYYVDFRYLRDLELRLGQFKVPSNRQRVISSGNLQLVDRSIMNSEFTLDRDVGVQVGSRDLGGLDVLRYQAGVFSGRGRDARGFGDFNLMYLGRVEVAPFGTFEDYVEADFDRGGPRLSIGATYAFIDRGMHEQGTHGSAPADGGTTTSHHIFGDLIFKLEGLTLLGEVAFRHGQRAPGDVRAADGAMIPTEPARDGYGVNAQAGYILPWLPLEVAGRFATVRSVQGSSLGDLNELTGGLSYYVMEHAYKIQADYSRLWETDGMDQGADRVRVQVQLTL
jgi:hypothetical protein